MPMTLGTRKATRQPYQCMSGTIRNGATALPIIDALLKMPTANARSRDGEPLRDDLVAAREVAALARAQPEPEEAEVQQGVGHRVQGVGDATTTSRRR